MAVVAAADERSPPGLATNNALYGFSQASQQNRTLLSEDQRWILSRWELPKLCLWNKQSFGMAKTMPMRFVKCGFGHVDTNHLWQPDKQRQWTFLKQAYLSKKYFSSKQGVPKNGTSGATKWPSYIISMTIIRSLHFRWPCHSVSHQCLWSAQSSNINWNYCAKHVLVI